LRKLQRWNLTSIFEEYRRYAGMFEGKKIIGEEWGQGLSFACSLYLCHIPLRNYLQFIIGSKVRLLNEQFIELFDTDLVGIPEVCPKWL
jgi:tyrosine-protein phosphatase OCA1